MYVSTIKVFPVGVKLGSTTRGRTVVSAESIECGRRESRTPLPTNVLLGSFVMHVATLTFTLQHSLQVLQRLCEGMPPSWGQSLYREDHATSASGLLSSALNLCGRIDKLW